MRAFRVCEHNNCNDRAKVMNGNISYCIKHYKKEKLREKEKIWFQWIIAWLPGIVVYWGTGKTTKTVETYSP